MNPERIEAMCGGKGHVLIKMCIRDRDGTLTDSGLGIMNSVQYALKKIGRGVENLEELKCFVGPPLAQQFAKFCGFSDEKEMCIRDSASR